MSRFGSTITDSDSKILNGLFNPYEWYHPSPKMNPQFEQQSPFGQPFGGKIQGLQSQFQQQKPLEQQALQQQGIQQQFQQPMQQLGADQQFQQPLQQKEIMQQQFQQPLQQQGMQQQFQQPLQQQFQQPLEQGLQQQYQQPLQQQQYFPQQLQQDQFQQPLQQQGVQQFQQPMQQPGLDQQFQQPLQQKEMIQPSEAAFQQGLSTFMGKGPQQFGFFPEMPATVFFEIRDIDRVGGKEKKFYEEKHKGKRIPIVDVSGTSRDVSYMQGNWNEWQKEAQKCIDKILKLNYKAYNHFQQFQNFKLIEGGINYQNDVDNWMNRLKKNLDNLMKENERLRAELPSGNWGSKGGFQGVRGGVDLQVSDAVDSSHVIKPSDIKKSHITSEKVGQWHPQQEKHTFTDKVKDTAIGIATTVENAALHPIESVGKIASTVEQAALHPILTVEKAADAVVHTVI